MASRIVGKGSGAILAWIFLGVTTAGAVTVTYEIADQTEFNLIIDPSAVLTTHATINTWLEGPTWVRSEGGGGYLVFCDQNNNRLKKLVPPDTVTDFLLPPANTLFNGTLLDGQGRLICAEAGSAGQKISMVTDGVVTPLVTTCNGLKFYSPNDVAVKSDGTIWFTDPNYNSGTPKGAPGYAAGYYVYRFDPADGNATCTAVMTNNFGRTSGNPRPNGICFSPDETKLYVADSDNSSGGHRIYVYSVTASNTLTGGTEFANINNGIPDGIKCDIDGRVWSSAGNGVHIYAPDRHLIARMKFQLAVNLCWGGPQYKTLYIVGQPLVTSMPVLVSGALVTSPSPTATPTSTPTSTPTPTPTPTLTPAPPTPTPTPAATATPTPATLAMSGNVSYCSSPSSEPVPNVLFSLTGDTTTSTLSDGSGNYQFSLVTSGGNYTVTPSKSALATGSTGINTIDVVATQRHFLNVTPISAGCRLAAADVNGDTDVNTIDVVAIQRFFLGQSTGIANVGKYHFTPASRAYPGIASDQTDQNYDTLVFGDVASPFAE